MTSVFGDTLSADAASAENAKTRKIAPSEPKIRGRKIKSLYETPSGAAPPRQ